MDSSAIDFGAPEEDTALAQPSSVYRPGSGLSSRSASPGLAEAEAALESDDGAEMDHTLTVMASPGSSIMALH